MKNSISISGTDRFCSTTHFNNRELLARQIKESGDTINDTAMITKIISSLPSKYWSFRQAWLSLEESKQTITNLTARLLDEEANLSSNENTDSAFVAGNSQTKSKENKESTKKTKFSCYNCGKKGHFARDGRKPKKSKNKHSRDGASQGSAFTTEVEEIEALVTGKTESSWLMDSGASRHMTPNQHWFT